MRIGVLNRVNRKNNTGLETFEQHVVPYLLEDDRFEAIDYEFRGGARAITSEILAGLKATRYARRNDLDVLFIPTHTAMMAVHPHRVGDTKVIPYVHDTLVLTSSFYGYAHQWKGRLWIQNVKRCEEIIAASYQTREDLIERNGVEGDVFTVYQGVGMGRPDEVPEYDERPYDLLYVGEMVNRKNPELLKAIDEMAYLSGLKMAYVNREELPFVGADAYINVPDEDLQKLYQKSKYYIHPSYAEGFGRTPIEAQRNGCVVIARDTSINNEVLGGIFKSIKSDSDVLNHVQNTPEAEWKAESENSLMNADRFTFKQTRKEIKRVLIDAAKN